MLKRQYRRDELRASGERMGGQILWTLQGETITATINYDKRKNEEGRGEKPGKISQ